MEQATKRNLIILTGPTAVGKTALSLRLAKALSGEIVSADSVQVYRHMDIGSAKIMPEEMEGVPHHLIDILEPDEPFSVMEFQKRAKDALAGIYERGNLPIVVGGTGFYIQALLYDIQFAQETADGYRQKLEQLCQEKGAKALHDMLKEIDPASAAAIHPNNKKRVIRALEYYHQNQAKISEHNETERRRESPYNFAYFVLNQNRQTLYEKIDLRVDKMVEQGLFDEVARLDAAYHLTEDMTSMQGIGYKEALSYLRGDCSREETIEILKRDTRHFAKRQLTWFRRERDVIWLDKDELGTESALLLEMERTLLERKIINHGVFSAT